MTDEQVKEAVYAEANKLRKTYLHPNHIWKALDNAGLKDQSALRTEIFKYVETRFREDEKNEGEYRRAKEQETLRQAARAQRLHPESAYRNDL